MAVPETDKYDVLLFLFRFFLGCKAAVACYNNKKQNFLVRAAQQCFPSLRTTSTCHQCCHTNNCNKELDPSDEAGWVQDHEGAEDFLGIYFSDSEEN